MEQKGSIVGTSKGKFEGVNRMVLKWTATIIMLCDHIGIFLSRTALVSQTVWYTMRVIGRMAFPIYCFLLVEGYFYTHDVKKYLARIAAFAVISEVPFDLFMKHGFFYLGYQNVFFTLFLGLLLVWGYDTLLVRKKHFLLGILVSVACVMAGYVINCDYGAEGVLMIFMFYYFRKNPVMRLLMVGVVMILMGSYEFYGILAMLLIAMYNGKSGTENLSPSGKKALQYFFYAFYPLHLLILSLL